MDTNLFYVAMVLPVLFAVGTGVFGMFAFGLYFRKTASNLFESTVAVTCAAQAVGILATFALLFVSPYLSLIPMAIVPCLTTLAMACVLIYAKVR